MDVARTHARASSKARGRGYMRGCGRALRNKQVRLLNGECWNRNGCAWSRLAGIELLGRDEAALRQQHKKRRKLPLVVAHAQVVGGRNKLYLMASHVNVPFAPGAHRAPQREPPAFPLLVKYRLVLLFLNGAHAMHAAHVVHAVHAETPASGGATFATPTIESRVTSAASCSSFNCAVPAGRSGKTRERHLAGLSQTRPSTAAGSAKPAFAATPRRRKFRPQTTRGGLDSTRRQPG